jgi:antitoxin CptB
MRRACLHERAWHLRLSAGGPYAVGRNGRVDQRLRAIKYRAHHRGTREADFMIGGYFDAHHHEWGPQELDWFEALLAEQDVDIMAWAIGTAVAPERYHGPMLDALRKLDYVKVHR